MKIPPASSNAPLRELASNPRTDAKTKPDARPAAAGASVALSAAARQLSALDDSSADIDVARVQQIRDALAAGELTMDPGRIADGILSDLHGLLK